MDFTLNPYHKNISDEELLADVKKVAEELSQTTLTRKEYREAGGKYGANTFLRRFGSRNAVLELCGLHANVYQIGAAQSSHDHYRVGTDDLLLDIQHVAARLGKDTMSSAEYDTHGKYSSATCFNRFPSWNDALTAAGLIPFVQKRGKRINDEDLLNEIERIWIQLGRQPTSSDIINGISKYSLHAYAKHFGGWRGALNAFIEYINSDIPSRDDVQDVENVSKIVAVTPIEAKISTSDDPYPHKTSRDVNLRLRFKVMQRDNFKCRICGATPATDPSVVLHIDHIVPWSRGGETTMSNLQTLCSKCNLGKSNLDI